MRNPVDTQSTPPESGATLELAHARALETTGGLVRTTRAHLRHGPFKRTRRRVRRQLARLDAVLEQSQLWALSGHAEGVDEVLAEILPPLDRALEHTLYHPLDKASLKALRGTLKAARHRLAHLVATLESVAA